MIIKLAKASNMIVVHIKREDETYLEEWVKEKGIDVPVISFLRDVKNIFNEDKKSERKRERLTNDQNSFFKKFSLV